MAQKRMFSSLVIGSDDFLEMPDSAQNLYFHLSMQADDDGFVDKWKSIMRMTGKKEDDLKILIAKSFVIPFDTGVIVIKHWRLNNYIQKDRYKETIHTAEKSLLSTDANNVYNLYTNCIHSIDKNSINNILPEPKNEKHKYGEYKNVLLKDEELEKLKQQYSNWEELIKYLDEYIEMKGYKAKSHYLAIKKWVVDAVKGKPSLRKKLEFQNYEQRQYDNLEKYYAN